MEAALVKRETGPFELTLFVSGASSLSSRAVGNVKALCEAHLGGRYRLNIVDLNQDPELARDRRVLATPTLLREHPSPKRMIVGDFSDHERTLKALVESASGAPGPEAGA